MFKKKNKTPSRDNFTEEPEDGWLLETNALVAENLFYSFQVQYVGHIVVSESLRTVGMTDQTAIVKELIMKTAEGAEIRFRKKRPKYPSSYDAFFKGQVDVGLIDVTLGISAEGMMIGAPNLTGDASKPVDCIFFHKMANISFAAGGDNEFYSLVAYVAKDEDGSRKCHVFECDELSDEVLETLGQSFGLAKDLHDKRKELEEKRKQRQLLKQQDPQPDPPKEHPVEAAAIYDMGASGGYLETEPTVKPTLTPNFEAAVYDTATDSKAVVEDPLYDAPTFAGDISEAVYDIADKSTLVQVLNKHTSVKRSMRMSTRQSKATGKKGRKASKELPPPTEPEKEAVDLLKADAEERNRPSWVVITPHDTPLGNTTSLQDLKKQFAQAASQSEQVIVEEEEDE